MDWPELVGALRPLGFRAAYDGHWMWHQEPEDTRRVKGGLGGNAEITKVGAYGLVHVFSGPYAEVVAYLQKEEKEKKP